MTQGTCVTCGLEAAQSEHDTSRKWCLGVIEKTTTRRAHGVDTDAAGPKAFQKRGLNDRLQFRFIADEGFKRRVAVFERVTNTDGPTTDLCTMALACRDFAQCNPHLPSV